MRLAFFVVVVGLVGCGSGGEPRLPVAGKVLWRGQPLTSGAVIFRPDSTKGNNSKHEPRGPIDTNGNYQAATAQQVGAPPGWYKIGVIATEAGDPKNPYAIPKSLLPAKYSDPEQSELFMEVVTNPAPGMYDITVRPE